MGRSIRSRREKKRRRKKHNKEKRQRKATAGYEEAEIYKTIEKKTGQSDG